MSTFFRTARPLRASLAGPAIAFAIALAIVPWVGCGESSDAKRGTTNPATANFSGSARQWVVPASVTAPAFSGVRVDLVGFEALAHVAQAAPELLAGNTVQASSSQCAAGGCAFQVRAVQLAGVTRGLYAKLSVPTGPAVGQWQDTYSMVLNSNQVLRSKQFTTALEAFGPATLSPAASVANFAQLAGLSTEAMLARGAAIAFVTPTRGASDTLGKGISGAFVSAVDSSQALTIIYPDETYRRTQNSGTNVDGAVLVVGPELSAASPASYAYEVKVQTTGSNLRFGDDAVLLRPNTFIITNLLPLP